MSELEDGSPAGLHRSLAATVRALHRHARAATADALAAVAAAEALPGLEER